MISLSGLTATTARTLGLSWPISWPSIVARTELISTRPTSFTASNSARIDVLAGQIDRLGVPAGMLTSLPRAVILPPSKTSVPFSITGPLTG